jgi:hypothetical protein
VFLTIVTMIGAAVAFGIGLQQWKRGQEWQRVERLGALSPSLLARALKGEL